jgi:hypothetical protein
MGKERTWKLLFYNIINGKSPIREFIESIKEREQAKVLSWISALKQEGINLHRPFADFLEDGIHELRIKLTGEQIRVLYFFCYRDFIVLTHTSIMNTSKVPLKEIKKAKKYRKDFLIRYNTIDKIRSLKNDKL